MSSVSNKFKTYFIRYGGPLVPPAKYLSNLRYKTLGAVSNYKYYMKNKKYYRSISNIFSESKPEWVAQVKSEHHHELAEVRKIFRDMNYPPQSAIEEKAGLYLYYLIRTKKPKIVLETGVANGFSSRMILSAMNKNRKGKLVSVDINGNVGQLLDKMDKSRWDLRVGDPANIFIKTVSTLKDVDIFIHDSDHSYKHMLFEFNSVYPKMSKDGFILSDDVDGNTAFVHFALSIDKKPILLDCVRKSFGILPL